MLKMFSTIKNLKEEDAIQIIYHLIIILNKGKNEPDDDIQFEQVTSELTDDQELFLNNILEEIDYMNIDNDESLDNYIFELYKTLEKITISKRDLNIERGRERLRKLFE